MKKYLIGGLAVVLALFIVTKTLVGRAPHGSSDIAPAIPSDSQKNAISVTTLDQGAFEHGKKQLDELSGEVTETPTSLTQKVYKWITSIVGFEEAILLTDDEFEEYQQWQSENGLLTDELKNSDYASYNKATLYNLAQQGDLSECLLKAASLMPNTR